ncbi:MAG: polymer-forming cytoskeletal protein [Halodesulfurarchaeum sp.]|nr:polymer-forming cytoskeletal protein [Halodesulfurarchaeum sp.]
MSANIHQSPEPIAGHERAVPEQARYFVLALVALLVLASGPTVALAGSAGGGLGATSMTGSAVVAEGETVNGLDVMAGTVVIRGTVAGDLNGFAGDVVIAESGVVTGDVSVATGSLRIAGTVEGSVSAGAGVVTLARTGSVGDAFSVGAGTVTVEGQVAGDATIGADTIALGSAARIGGELRYDGALTQESGAVVDGPIVQDSSIGGFGPVGVSGHSWFFFGGGWLNAVYGLFANLLLGAVLLLVLPDFSNRVADRAAASPGWSVLVGLLALIGIPFLLALVAVTIVGIPLAILGLFGYLFVLWVGVVYGEYAVGRWLLGRRSEEPNRWYALGLGLVLFAVLGAIPVVGGLLVFSALLVGLGGLVSAIRGAYRRRGSGATPTTVTEGSESTSPV